MRIALVTQLFAPEFEGGTEQVVRAQARALQRRGHEVLVVCGSELPHEGRDVVWDRHGSLDVARLPRLESEVGSLELSRPRLESAVRRLAERVELCHVHHWSTLSSGLVRTLGHQAPVVVTLHDAFAACPRSFRSSPDPFVTCPPATGFVPCVRCLAPDAGGLPEEALIAGLRARHASFAGELAVAAAVLAPSHFQAARMKAVLGLAPGRVEVLPHGLCRDLHAPAASADWGGHGPLRVLHFGHLVQAKGILDLVRSLAALPIGAAELDLAGAVLEPGLEDAVRAAAGTLPVRLHGSYGSSKLAGLAAEAHLAAFPSRLDETYGLVVDEAAALGLAAWVSDRGALPERLLELGGGGRVLPAANVPAWTAAFEALLADPDELGEERSCVVPPAGPSRAAQRLAELYLDLTSART